MKVLQEQENRIQTLYIETDKGNVYKYSQKDEGYIVTSLGSNVHQSIEGIFTVDVMIDEESGIEFSSEQHVFDGVFKNGYLAFKFKGKEELEIKNEQIKEAYKQVDFKGRVRVLEDLFSPMVDGADLAFVDRNRLIIHTSDESEYQFVKRKDGWYYEEDFFEDVYHKVGNFYSVVDHTTEEITHKLKKDLNAINIKAHKNFFHFGAPLLFSIYKDGKLELKLTASNIEDIEKVN